METLSKEEMMFNKQILMEISARKKESYRS